MCNKFSSNKMTLFMLLSALKGLIQSYTSFKILKHCFKNRTSAARPTILYKCVLLKIIWLYFNNLFKFQDTSTKYNKYYPKFWYELQGI